MVRYRLSTLFFAILVIALIGGVLYCLSHWQDALAELVVSENSATELTRATVIELTASALRTAGYGPIKPLAGYGTEGRDPEPELGRNTLRPNDEVDVLWKCKTRTL